MLYLCVFVFGFVNLFNLGVSHLNFMKNCYLVFYETLINIISPI